MRIIIQRFRSLLLLPALLASALFAACNDTPSPVGSEYLPQNIVFGSYTLKPEDFTVSSGIASVSNTSAQGGLGIDVGRTPDGTVAHGLVGITTQSPLLSGADAKPVKSATLKLHALPYRQGDTSGSQISFDLVVLDEVFPSNVQWSDELAARIEAAPSLGTYTGAYPTTTSATLDVTLDPAATGTFLQEYFRYETGTNGQEFKTLKTLALRAGAGNKFVGGFFGLQGVADSLRPTLQVTATTPAGDSTVTLNIGTTGWIARSPVTTGPGTLMVMGGVPIRSLLKLNIDSVPAGATIHQAELKLHIDTANSRFGTFGQPRYVVGYIATDTSFKPQSYLTTNVSGFLPVSRMALDSATFSNTYRFTTLGPTISAWLRNRRGAGTLTNQGIILAFNRGASLPDLETPTVDRVVFFGPDAADPAVRPSLTIIYSVQVDANK